MFSNEFYVVFVGDTEKKKKNISDQRELKGTERGRGIETEIGTDIRRANDHGGNMMKRKASLVEIDQLSMCLYIKCVCAVS